MRSEVEWKVRRLSETYAITAATSDHLAHIVAKWVVRKGHFPAGPDEVTVKALGWVRETSIRGVTTGVLRSAENLLVSIVAEFPEKLKQLDVESPMEQLQLLANDLDGTPRTNPRYYDQLLPLFAEVEAAGSSEPVKDLAELLNLNRDTLKTQLRAARRQATSGKNPRASEVPQDAKRTGKKGA